MRERIEDCAQLQGASLDGASSWRADIRNTETGPTFVVAVRTAMSVDEVARLETMVREAVPEGQLRRNALARIDKAFAPDTPPSDLAAMEKAWSDLESSPPDPDDFMRSVTTLWRGIGCSAGRAPFVLRRLIERMDLYSPSGPDGIRQVLASGNADVARVAASLSELARAFLEPGCAGAKGLTEELAVLTARPWERHIAKQP